MSDVAQRCQLELPLIRKDRINVKQHFDKGQYGQLTFGLLVAWLLLDPSRGLGG